jgi:membrane-bound lytic murein transglycosylase D
LLNNRSFLHSLLVFSSLVAFTGCSSINSKKADLKAEENIKQAVIIQQAPASNTPVASSIAAASSPDASRSAANKVIDTQPVQTAATQSNTPTTPATSAITPGLTTGTDATVASLTASKSATSDITTVPAVNQIDVWQRIRNGFAMREPDSKQVARFENWYAARPDYVERMTDRARRYLFFIVEEVEKRHMPTEIALLPMIESAFNPGANSSARASGIWQFIPSTGKHFGMEQNWWYDGRRDVISATNGALDYLQKLHDQFGSWDLALAAYNAGENSVMRAIIRNRKQHKPTDYASLRLPKETRQDVPKLMAIKNIVSYPQSFGLTLTDIPNKAYFAEVTTNKHIDVELAAEMAGISMEEFAALNPAHSRPVILRNEDDVLLLPVDSVETFHANLEKTDQRLVSWQACPTKRGEKLDVIATRYGISPEKLRIVNGIYRTMKISNGQTLLVPLNGEQPENEFTAFNTNLPPTDYRMLNAIKHTVRRGDTLSGIAHRYHVKLSSLKSWNRGVRILHPGQHILVAQPSRVQNAAKTKRNFKRVSTHLRKKTVTPEKM